MRLNINTVKASDIFPVMGVFGGVVVSVKGAFTIGWELTLPRLYHQSEQDYDSIIASFASACRVLPAWSVIHRQDFFTYETYDGSGSGAKTYLEQCYQRHFHGRRYLTHKAYLFVSIGNRAMLDKESRFSGLFGISGTIALPSESELDIFRSKAGEFIQTLTSCGLVSARLLDQESEWIGDGKQVGIIQRYMMLGNTSPVMSDIATGKDYVEAYGKRAQAYVLCESQHMPQEMNSVKEVKNLSTPVTQLMLSTGSHIGCRLDCEHVINHYIVIPPQQETLRELDRRKRDMTAGYRSNDNRLNAGDISLYLDDIHRTGAMTVFAHLNVFAWGELSEQNDISAKLSAAISAMGATAVRNKHNTPVLWYAGIPSNAFEICMDNLMRMRLGSSFPMGNFDTFDDGFGRGALVLCDRTRCKPVRVDVDREAEARKLIDSWHKFVIGPTGSGKSFLINRLLTCEYEDGAYIFVLDVGHSYRIHTSLVSELTGGRDGQYNTWSKDKPLSFNPFIGFTSWVDEAGVLNVDEPGFNALLALLETLWEPQGGWKSEQEAILKQLIKSFTESMIRKGFSESDLPLFDDFYNFLKEEVEPLFEARLVWMKTRDKNLERKKELEGKLRDAAGSKTSKATIAKMERELSDLNEALVETGLKLGTDYVGYEDFDLKGLHKTMTAYSKQGEFSTFLNSKHPVDIVGSRWTIFELKALSELNDKTFYSLCVLQIMHAFDLKMRSIPDRKVLFIDEAWTAIANKTMAPYLHSLWKTARKYSTSCIVITQELQDITSSEVIKKTILANSPVKILLDQSGSVNTLTAERKPGDEDDIRTLLGLTPKDVELILSMNRAVRGNYREVFIKYQKGLSMVLSVEVSPEEALVYESNFEKKKPLLQKVKELGSYKASVEAIVAERKKKEEREMR